ncbi:MAG: hypothetical protein ACYCZX_01320 [Rhodospirillaceae bacterium]
MAAPVKFTARFATAGNVAVVEQWLSGNVRGKWNVKLESVSDDLTKKVYALDFEQASDRTLFRTRFTGKSA